MKNAKVIPFAEPPKKGRRIAWTPADVRAVVMARLGFSNNCLRAHHCDLSDGQIGYRMKLANSQKARKEFRDGTSPLAKRVMHDMRDYAEGQVERMIHKQHQTDTRKAAS